MTIIKAHAHQDNHNIMRHPQQSEHKGRDVVIITFMNNKMNIMQREFLSDLHDIPIK